MPPDVLGKRPAAARPLAEDAAGALLRRHLPQGADLAGTGEPVRVPPRLPARGVEPCGRRRYTRYADDLVFSGDETFERGLRRFHVHVCRIVLEEGFEINTRKSHFMRQGVRQQVAGIVLNSRPNVPRADFDRLNAILTNCVRHGPNGQNRDGHDDFRAHLAGASRMWR